MTRSKKKPFGLDQSTIETLRSLMTDLQKEITKFQTALDGSFTWAGLLTNAENVYQLAGAIRDKMPKQPKRESVGLLCQHAFFVKHYAAKKERGSIDSNFTALRIDFKNVNEEIDRIESKLSEVARGTSTVDVDFIKDPITLGYVEESFLCLNAGAYRACVIMAACALESFIRTIYQETKEHDSSGLPFSRVIQVLEEDKSLLPDQTAIVNICRSFRNLTAHPSGFTCTKDEADSLLRLAIEQLKRYYAQ